MTTGNCPYCHSERYVEEDGGVICHRCGATFVTEENTQDPALYMSSLDAEGRPLIHIPRLPQDERC